MSGILPWKLPAVRVRTTQNPAAAAKVSTLASALCKQRKSIFNTCLKVTHATPMLGASGSPVETQLSSFPILAQEAAGV